MLNRNEYTEELAKLAKPDSDLFLCGMDMFNSSEKNGELTDADACSSINSITALIQSAMTYDQIHSEKYFELSKFGYTPAHYSLKNSIAGISEPARALDFEQVAAAAEAYVGNKSIYSSKFEWILLEAMLYIEAISLLRFVFMGDQHKVISSKGRIIKSLMASSSGFCLELFKIGGTAAVLNLITQDVVATTLGTIVYRSSSNIIKSNSFHRKIKIKQVILAEEIASAHELLSEIDFNAGQLMRTLCNIENNGGRFNRLVFHILDKRLRRKDCGIKTPENEIFTISP